MKDIFISAQNRSGYRLKINALPVGHDSWLYVAVVIGNCRV